MLKKLMASGAFLFLASCASPSLQIQQLQFLKQTTPERVVLGVPHYLQKQNHCGPATLAMALSYKGHPVSMDEIEQMAFSPKAKGTYQMDMLATARRMGRLTLSVNHLSEVIEEVAAGNPVIVFQNLGFSWLPLWHYSVITGYDLSQSELILHSGAEKNMRLKFQHFEKGWRRAGYWGFVSLQPGEISPTANAFEHIKAGASLEAIGLWQEAETAYGKMLQTWPNEFLVHLGLGNVAFQKQDFKLAKKHYESAVKLKPAMLEIQQNLALVNQKLKQ